MVSPLSSATNGVDFSGLGLGVPRAEAKEELGQEAFLQLMLTQLKNQDPFKPMESGDFLGQIAQFGTVSGLAGLQTSFDSLASSLVSNQALQAASLVGRSALAEGSRISLVEGQGAAGAIDLPSASGSVTVEVRDATGQTVRRIALGAQTAGLTPFAWDGQTDDGAPAAAGRYTFVAGYQTATGSAAARTLISAPVDSVRFGATGFSVDLRGIGEVPFSAVREIRNSSVGSAATGAAAN